MEYKQPVLVETFLPGREFTVGIVGNGPDAKTVGIMEVIIGKMKNPRFILSSIRLIIRILLIILFLRRKLLNFVTRWPLIHGKVLVVAMQAGLISGWMKKVFKFH